MTKDFPYDMPEPKDRTRALRLEQVRSELTRIAVALAPTYPDADPKRLVSLAVSLYLESLEQASKIVRYEEIGS